MIFVPDCVVPEEQCRRKRMEKKEQRTPTGVSGSTANSVATLSPVNNNNSNSSRDLQQHQSRAMVATPGPNDNSSYGVPTNLTLTLTRRLKPEQEELINRLVYFQEEFEQPSEEDLKKVYHVPLNSTSSEIDESESLFRHITEITILTVQLIVQFSRHLPGFQTLNRADQVILL